MSEQNLLDYVITNLKEDTGSWSLISVKTGVSFHTISKIAYKKTKDPGVKKIQKLANYFYTKSNLDKAA